jgi:hypothetical protein
MKEDEIGRAYSTKRNANMILVGKSEGRRPIGRLRHGWIILKIYLKEIGLGGVDWIHLAQNRE